MCTTANAFVQIVMTIIFKEEEPKVSAMAALLTLSLLTLHCWRRFYESHKLQVFARTSKINLFYYGTAYVHYAALILITVGQAPLFCGKQKGEIQWTDDWTKLFYIPCIFLFLLASYGQYSSNVVLANLRRDKNGAVVTILYTYVNRVIMQNYYDMVLI
ncbi:putative polyprenol reductase [Papilio machaon]|uniref:Polyprenal reductase n=1 Tax=Papilio machaon TaxID=76193 RepID=A0A194QM89_PAPMA|nr:putative polyprenol reductase [Papilio machaon]